MSTTRPTPVIFLDFDGVLNSLAWYYSRVAENPDCMLREFDRDAVRRVNRLIEATGAKVVISSSWRRGRTLEQMRTFLDSQGFVGDILGVTPKHAHAIRGNEIQEWMTDNHCLAGRIVILDDESDMVALGNRLVQTTWADGLQDHHVEAAIALLL